MADPVEVPGFGMVRAVQGDDGAIRLESSATRSWIVELMPRVELSPTSSSSAPAPAAIGVAAALGAALPELAGLLQTAAPAAQGVARAGTEAGDLIVRFSPQIREGLLDGTFELVRSGGRLLPRARNVLTGQFDQTAEVIGAAGATAAAAGVVAGSGGAGIAGAGAAGAAGTAGVAGAAGISAPVLLPLAIAAGAALAASWAQQRWLEQTFAGVERALARIETRLRDDDFGTLDGAEALLEVIGDRAAFGELAPQVRAELAVAHRQVEAIYRSRLRFVERFKGDLERWQVDAIGKDGRAVTWTPEVVKALIEDDSTTVAELVVFFQAMLTRARISTATAALLVTEGDAASAFRIIDDVRSSVRHDYFDLHNRLAALARVEIDASIWKNPFSSKDRKKAHEIIALLAGNLDRAIGEHLPEPDQVVEFVVPASAFELAGDETAISGV
jgi:hypothetical protein